MGKKYSYVGIAFVILLFGIYTVPKVVNHFKAAGNLHKFNKVPEFEFINQKGKTITNKHVSKTRIFNFSPENITL